MPRRRGAQGPRRIEDVPAAPLLTARHPRHAAVLLKLHRAFEQRAAALRVSGERSHLFEALDRVLGRDLRVMRDQWFLRRVDAAQLQAQAFWIREQQPAFAALATDASMPEIERRRG